MIVSALYWAAAAALFLVAWAVFAAVFALLYRQLCRLADRRAAEIEEMRDLLSTLGRIRQEEHRARMIANADAMAREVQDARAMRRILRDVRRAPLVSVEDIDRLPEVG